MITISNLNFSYDKHRVLFRDMNMQLNPGHIYGLFGENGAGKSTLLKNITGLVFARSGTVDVMGFDPKKRQPALLQEICFIPEEFDLPPIHVNAYLKGIAPFYPKFDQEQFRALLTGFDIPQGQRLNQMSYGQKKKFIIAFGLATQAKLVIMDEPTNGLDIPSKAQFRKIMASALTDDRCIIISTHQVRDLENLIDTVIILDENKVTLMASVEEITQKLCFKQVKQVDDAVIYSESSVGGHHAVLPNVNHEESKLDIELLFNALLTRNGKITRLFN